MTDEVLLEAKQNEEYFQEECNKNCYCKKINRDFPIIEIVCNYCFLANKHNLILGEYIYKLDIMEEEIYQKAKDDIIKAIPNFPEIAKNWHNCYEKTASEQGWNTQKDCRVEFDKLPEKNKRVMLIVSKLFMDSLINDIKEVKIDNGK